MGGDSDEKICVVLLVLVWIFAAGCAKEPAEKFTFTMETPKTTLTVGEKVTYTIHLTNHTGKACTLVHAMPLMSVYIVNADDPTEYVVGATEVSTDMQAGETIEKTCSFQPMEAGEYLLKTSCWFETDGEEYDLKKEPIPIIVLSAEAS